MNNKLSSQLEEIEKILSSVTANEIEYRGLKLMEDISKNDEGLLELYSRSCAYDEPVVKNAMSFILAKKARKFSLLAGKLLFDFVEKLEENPKPQTILNTLSAIESNFISGSKWGENLNFPRNFYKLIQNSLTCSGEMNLVIQDAAISLLLVICEMNELNNFTNLQKKLILKEISSQPKEVIPNEEVKKLTTCLQNFS
jgi:hypothetical protein